MAEFSASPNGKHVVVVAEDVRADIRFVPTAGGAIRGSTTSQHDDWPIGWASDSRMVFAYSEDDGKGSYHGIGLDGLVALRLPMPEGQFSPAFVFDGALIEEKRGWGQDGVEVSYERFDLANQSRRTLVRGTRDGGCCRAPGGVSRASADEFFYTRMNDARLEVRAVHRTGADRLVSDLPESALGAIKAVFGDRVAYTTNAGDSVRLSVRRASGTPMTLSTFSAASRPNEFAWSHDGRQLVVALGGRQQQVHVYPFDATGRPAEAPTELTLPFLYQSHMLWIPDGSGFTVYAQTSAAPARYQIAVVRLADPQRPTILTGDDPNYISWYVLSPDGSTVAYASRVLRGNSVWLIDVKQALAEVRPQR